MTYNLCYFLGNKAFVIDFLEKGLLCCVCLRLTGKDLSGENKYPPIEFRRAYCSTSSGVFAIILQQNNKIMKKSVDPSRVSGRL